MIHIVEGRGAAEAFLLPNANARVVARVVVAESAASYQSTPCISLEILLLFHH